MDTRQALLPGSKVSSPSGIEYEIEKEVGRGASCIVYEGKFKDALNNLHHIRIKELYPYDLGIERNLDNTILVPKNNYIVFQNACKKFLDAYSRNVELHNTFGIVNSTMAPQEQFQFGCTWYIISTCTEGQDYASVQDSDVRSVFRRIKTISTVIQKYHNKGYLYLDLKPENIFIIPETDEHIILFDFDSIIKKEELNKDSRKRISFSSGYAAPELIRSNRRKICEATDIYAIGAIVFQKLFGRVPNSMDCSVSSKFAFETMTVDVTPYPSVLFKYLTDFFHKTLSASVGYRYKTIEEMFSSIEKIIKYSDRDAQYLLENFSYSSVNFTGREKELAQIDESLNEADIVFLSGIGGIGKTELAKKYANTYKKNYSKVVFLTFQDSIKNTVCSDDLTFQNMSRDGDSVDDYFNRKIFALKQEIEDSDDKRPILLILDNFDVDGDDDLDKFLDCGCKIIITSRTDFSDYDYPQIDISRMNSHEDLIALFESYNTVSYSDKETGVLYELFDLVDGHTMTVVLIAKYLRESMESPFELKDRFIAVGGLNNTEETLLVKHRKDKKHRNKNVMNHLRILFDVSRISEVEKEIMRSFSLLGYVRIKREVFLEILNGLGDEQKLDTLIRHGWVEYDTNSGKISLHQVILDLMYDQLSPTSENCPNFMDGFYNYLKKETEIYYERDAKDKLCDILLQRLKGHDYRYARLCVLRKKYLDEAARICTEAVERGDEALKYYVLLTQIMNIKANGVGGNTDDYIDIMESADDDFGDKDYIEHKLNKTLSIVHQEIAYARKASGESSELIHYFLDIIEDLDSYFEACAFWYMDDEIYCMIYSLQLELLKEVERLLPSTPLKDEERLNCLVKIRNFYGANLIFPVVFTFEHYTNLKAAFKYQKQVNELREKIYPGVICADANDFSLLDCREELLNDEDLKNWESLLIEELDEDDSLTLDNIKKLMDTYKQAQNNMKAIKLGKVYIEVQNRSLRMGRGTDGKSNNRDLFGANYGWNNKGILEETAQVYYTLAELLVHEGKRNEAGLYLKESIAKLLENQRKLDSSEMVQLLKSYNALICILEEKELIEYKEQLKIILEQYYYNANELSEEISSLIVKYIDEKFTENERINALDSALKRYAPCISYVSLPQNDLLFHYAESVYRELGDVEMLFELLRYHVSLLQEGYTNPPTKEEEELLKEMRKIVQQHEDINKYQVALYHRNYINYYERSSSEFHDDKVKESKLCDFYLIAENESKNQDYAKKIELWDDAQRQYGYIDDYKDQLRCFKQLNKIWEELYGSIRFNRYFYEYGNSIYNEMQCYEKLHDYEKTIEIHKKFLKKIQENKHTVYKDSDLYNAVDSNAFSLKCDKLYPEAFHAYIVACILMFKPKFLNEKLFDEFDFHIHRNDLSSEQICNLLHIVEECKDMETQGYEIEERYRKEFDWLVHAYQEHEVELKRK